MPKLSKRKISGYLKSECKRRFVLDLFQDSGPSGKSMLKPFDMPTRQPERPGFALVAAAGDEWQHQKVTDLIAAFGPEWVVSHHAPTEKEPYRYLPLDLKRQLKSAKAGLILVEPEYDFATPQLIAEFGMAEMISLHDLSFSKLRPDLLIVLDGAACQGELLQDGSIAATAEGDGRLALRAVDIKLTTEPSAAYYCETVLYSIALAAWLVSTGLNKHFKVAPNPAVWPGSYERSPLLQAGERVRRRRLPEDVVLPPSLYAEVARGLDDELEITPVSVFVPRLRRLFETELPQALSSGAAWRSVEWGVSARCRNCDYLGMTWSSEKEPDARLCYPTSVGLDHLSRLAFVSRGALRRLESQAVKQVSHVAGLEEDHAAFESHSTLRASAQVVRGRARSLAAGASGLVLGTATSAQLARRPDLSIYMLAEFDPSSAITGALAFRAVRWPPAESADRTPIRTEHQFLVSSRSLTEEGRVFLEFLQKLREVMTEADSADPQLRMQVFIWDNVTYEHLTRLVGRHLDAILAHKGFIGLAWLFPDSDRQIGNADLIGKGTAVAIVANIVRTSIAVPTPHVHTLLGTAQWYHPSSITDPVRFFSVSNFFQDPLGSQVPMERIHELWNPSSNPGLMAARARDWQRTISVKLAALNAIVTRLAADMRGQLVAVAPRLRELKRPVLKQNMPPQGQLMYAFAALNAALERQETMFILALPAKEREARFYSARLTTLLSTEERKNWLDSLAVPPDSDVLTYRIAPGSSQAKVKEGDFLRFLAAPDHPWFARVTLGSLMSAHGEPDPWEMPTWANNESGMSRLRSRRLDQILEVTVQVFDRVNGRIALSWNNTITSPLVPWLTRTGVIDLRGPIMLDPKTGEFLLEKLEKTLKVIGVTPAAQALSVGHLKALGELKERSGQTADEESPTSEMLWDAKSFVDRQSAQPWTVVHPAIDALYKLNPAQRSAVERICSRRFTLVWGPPGTGKTHTLAASIANSLLHAVEASVAERILVCTETYEAFGEVLRSLMLFVHQLTALDNVQIVRMSRLGVREEIDGVKDVWRTDDSGRVTLESQALLKSLSERAGCTVVFSTPHQVFNLIQKDCDSLQPLFDAIVLDEGGQMNMASAVLALAPLAVGGRAVIAGDPLQLPPILQVDPPSSLKPLLGSAFSYFENVQGIDPIALDINYRSSAGVISAYRNAGYRSLVPWSPNLSLGLRETATHDLADSLLDDSFSSFCVIHDDGESAQLNELEAEFIVKVIARFSERTMTGLRNERDASGEFKPVDDGPPPRDQFWKSYVGAVTVHRAQQAAVFAKLCALFPEDDPALIRGAVDTVERFQGQQRNLIVCSFSVGDADLIRDEDEFLMDLRRFNVILSRARAKVIVFVTRELLDHLSDDVDVLRESAFLKHFVSQHCTHASYAEVGFGTSQKRVEIRRAR